MQKHLPERVQKGQGTMRAFTFENATRLFWRRLCERAPAGGGEAVWGNGDAGICGGSIKTNGIYQEVMDVLKLAGKR